MRTTKGTAMGTFVFFAALMLLATSAFAQAAKTDKDGVIIKPVFADTPDKFAEQTLRIHADMQVGGRYEFTNPADKRTIDRLLGQMANRLQSAGSVEAMNHNMRLALFNDQEEVNGILKHNDSNRLVCESRAPIGTNILRTTCHTYGQIQTTARNTKEGLMQYDLSRLCNGPAPSNSHPDADPCAPGTHQARLAPAFRH
jgi:hypothetical protein